MSSRRPVFLHCADRRKPVRYAGFSLIELMVAMVLGLIVIAGVGSVFLANQSTARANRALGDVQDNARTAFEMMSRDIRNAGLTGCSNSGRIANVLKNGPSNGGTTWWADWNNALVGYGAGQTDPAVATGSAAGNRVSGTDALILLGGEGMGTSVAVNAEPTATFTLNEASSDLQAGDIIVVCDPDHTALTQITRIVSGVITHAANTGSPGNCTTDLNFPTACASTASYVFAPNAQVTRLNAANWYIGNNPEGGKSLYRTQLANSAGTPTPTAQEMVRNVANMSIAYHQAGNADFVAASAVSNWAQVDAVQTRLWLESTDQRAGTDSKALRRDFTAITTVRNRVN